MCVLIRGVSLEVQQSACKESKLTPEFVIGHHLSTSVQRLAAVRRTGAAGGAQMSRPPPSLFVPLSHPISLALSLAPSFSLLLRAAARSLSLSFGRQARHGTSRWRWRTSVRRSSGARITRIRAIVTTDDVLVGSR